MGRADNDKVKSATAATPRSVGEVAVSLLIAANRQDVIFLAADDVRASEIARAAEGGAGDITVLLVPGSDALPGDSSPPSPANVGLRTAALRKLRLALSHPKRSSILLISTAEAAARLVPPPVQYDPALPEVKLGDRIDLASFTEELEAIGYFSDDRVDEPGELALRGQVIDVFPADSGSPYRLEAQDGTLAAIRAYDPATQLTNGECDQLALGRASEPQLGEGVTLLDHLRGAALAVEPGAERRRLQYLRLAADAANRRPDRAMRDICTDARWQSALEDHDEIALEDRLRRPAPALRRDQGSRPRLREDCPRKSGKRGPACAAGQRARPAVRLREGDEDAEDRDGSRSELGGSNDFRSRHRGGVADGCPARVSPARRPRGRVLPTCSEAGPSATTHRSASAT